MILNSLGIQTFTSRNFREWPFQEFLKTFTFAKIAKVCTPKVKPLRDLLSILSFLETKSEKKSLWDYLISSLTGFHKTFFRPRFIRHVHIITIEIRIRAKRKKSGSSLGAWSISLKLALKRYFSVDFVNTTCIYVYIILIVVFSVF